MRYLNSGIFQHEVLEYVKGNNDVQKDVQKELSEKQVVILELIYTSPEATLIEMSRKLKVSDKTIQREFTAIRKLGINIERQDGRKEGKWVIKIEK